MEIGIKLHSSTKQFFGFLLAEVRRRIAVTIYDRLWPLEDKTFTAAGERLRKACMQNRIAWILAEE